MPGARQAHSPAQLDAIARERGFPDYASWMAWHKKYRSPDQGAWQQAQQPTNWLQTLLGKIPVHPAYSLSKAADAMRGAQEGQ